MNFFIKFKILGITYSHGGLNSLDFKINQIIYIIIPEKIAVPSRLIKNRLLSFSVHKQTKILIAQRIVYLAIYLQKHPISNCAAV